MRHTIAVGLNIFEFQWNSLEFIQFLGYEFTLPFLSDECGLSIDSNYVIPLYKHCINALHPTMAIIGYVFTSAITQMIDIQVILIKIHITEILH